jgi:hypothetical protein
MLLIGPWWHEQDEIHNFCRDNRYLQLAALTLDSSSSQYESKAKTFPKFISL